MLTPSSSKTRVPKAWIREVLPGETCSTVGENAWFCWTLHPNWYCPSIWLFMPQISFLRKNLSAYDPRSLFADAEGVDQHVESNKGNRRIFRREYLRRESNAHAWWNCIPALHLLALTPTEPGGMWWPHSRGDSTTLSWGIRASPTWQTSLSLSRERGRELPRRGLSTARRDCWNWATSNACTAHRAQSCRTDPPGVLFESFSSRIFSVVARLTKQDISHLETPINTLFCLEPNPYGTEVVPPMTVLTWKVRKFEYREDMDWFVECKLSPGGL